MNNTYHKIKIECLYGYDRVFHKKYACMAKIGEQVHNIRCLKKPRKKNKNLRRKEKINSVLYRYIEINRKSPCFPFVSMARYSFNIRVYSIALFIFCVLIFKAFNWPCKRILRFSMPSQLAMRGYPSIFRSGES
jgi:hypothetical protein